MKSKTISKYHSGTEIKTIDGKTTIMVNGKSVDPDSKKGKKIIAEAKEKMNKTYDLIDSIMLKAEKMIEGVTSMFKL